MIKKTSKISEFNHFTNLANEWWKPAGKFKILHTLTPLRIKYIKSMFCNENRNFKTIVFCEHVYQMVRKSLYKRSTGEPVTHSVLRFKRKFGCFMYTCTKETLVCKSHIKFVKKSWKSIGFMYKRITTTNVGFRRLWLFLRK